MNNRKNAGLRLLLLAAALLILYAVSLLLGRYPTPGLTSPAVLRGDRMAQLILTSIRLPRCTAAVLLGAALGCGGLVFQLIFANPLVEPGFLGISQGAAFGAGLAILLGGQALLQIQLFAAAAALAGLALSYFLAQRLRFGGWLLRLLLAGIAVSALFSAGLGFIKTVADPLTQLPELSYWMLGGLSGITAQQLLKALPAIVLPMLILFTLRWRINILSARDQSAYSMGLNPKAGRLLILCLAVIPVAAVTALSGIVMWVGLIVPHLARKLFGADASRSLPGAILIGGIFGLVCDNAARLLFPGEIPLGIMTALLGVTLFIIILTRPETEQTC
ncbi:MAG: iron ABC transporter permease [Spirochaetales bacterium]|uniref:Iron ABC transporter permease n=1 Tax=Candidatus Thalassospirochaeta sargassi TaxID=3119039 RepID=A0AAJ1IJY4_9SPIO|nr:iron ABC transporter permease [Spirochaetales bacterium]